MTVVAWILIATTVASWLTVVILVRAALVRPHIRFLTAVTAAALVGAVGSSLLLPLAVGVIADLDYPRTLRALLLIGGVLLFSLPGPAFLVLYQLGWFEAGGKS